MTPTVPDKPALEGIEAKWSSSWEADGTYAFDRTRPRAEVFSIDTPPPTVSGSLHVGHVFSFTQTDCVARFHRMRGRAVFYPMGWDDNGLPTERRVENYFGVRCDPTLGYDPAFTPPDKPDPKKTVSVSRPNFIELCLRLTVEDEKAFENLFRRLGLSVDWSVNYVTIGERARRASQRAFLRNLARGEAYSAEAPTIWDVTYQTAVAQAEIEDRELPGAYHRYGFRSAATGNKVYIETTRPELLAACVALVAHPDDPRYQPLFGTAVTSPLFGVDVPVLAHELAQPDKGSGVAMICTFGDTTDVTWWRELNLPVRSIVERNGRLKAEPPDVITSEAGRAAYAEIAGKTIKQAQTRVVELLIEAGELDGEPRAISHPVKFYERGDRPLEVVTSRQWYIRNGGRDEALRADLRKRGVELAWHPDFMRHRYDSWVEGLNGDWLISRQRFFGVSFPVWYRLDDNGTPDHDHPILAAEEDLPVDPSSDVPPGYREDQRGQPGGFIGDPDVMDTWATSSLTPQIACGWEDDPDLFSRTFPMDMRPQAHEIIRTWLFSTVVRSHFEHGTLPWTNAALSGWILDPDRKKMAKSKGNVVLPTDPLDAHGADGVRYWAASGRPGTDTAYDENQMKVGRRLAIKILNASKFALNLGSASTSGAGGAAGAEAVGGATAVSAYDVDGAAVSWPLDEAMLHGLGEMVAVVTAAFEDYDYARALERTETFFWAFCDNYLELAKGRAYGSQGSEGAASARVALTTALSVMQRLFAPFLPYVTEEVWSWWQEGSIHRATWPEPAEITAALPGVGAAGGGEVGDLALSVASSVLGVVRRAKSEAKRSMRWAVDSLTVTTSPDRAAALRSVAPDLREAGVITTLTVTESADQPAGDDIVVVLSDPPVQP
jgi:valyl-tRNA synthetase